jgi:hypothetical protein
MVSGRGHEPGISAHRGRLCACGNATGIVDAQYVYGHATYGASGTLHDVTTGSNGSCGGSYLCTGRAGFDGPTGLGTPQGTGGF